MANEPMEPVGIGAVPPISRTITREPPHGPRPDLIRPQPTIGASIAPIEGQLRLPKIERQAVLGNQFLKTRQEILDFLGGIEGKNVPAILGKKHAHIVDCWECHRGTVPLHLLVYDKEKKMGFCVDCNESNKAYNELHGLKGKTLSDFLSGSILSSASPESLLYLEVLPDL